ncbi:MAG TPA: HAD family hydrolase [Terracidiphilus sp.]|jgi:D-glycero-D-manno-heptose 1,7-bisphosphate phosphatase
MGHRLKDLTKTVFLDRDGVINQKMPEGEYVSAWKHFRLLPGAAEAIGKLKRAGLRVLVVSNQRGIALGFYAPEDVDYIHAQLQEKLNTDGAKIDGFYFCPHDKRVCNCRKPLPGLFEQARSQFQDITAESSTMIGDSLSDIEFGRNLGMKTIFIEGEPNAREHQKPGASKAAELADQRFDNLLDAVNCLLQESAAD